MTHEIVTGAREAEFAAEAAAVPEIYVYSHSTLVYWWPAWAFGYLFAALNTFVTDPNNSQHPASGLGLSYVALLILLIIFTNVRLRGIYSVVTLISIGFIVVLFAWLGWWDEIAKILPYLKVQMTTGFSLVFSSALLFVWLTMFLIFDRMTYWRIRPGQMTVEHVIGGGAESFDTNTLRFQKMNVDMFRTGLGLGSGDLEVVGAGPEPRTMSNVLFAD